MNGPVWYRKDSLDGLDVARAESRGGSRGKRRGGQVERLPRWAAISVMLAAGLLLADVQNALAVDIEATGFTTNVGDLKVEFSISGGDAPNAFTIGIYAWTAEDPQNPDLIQTYQISGSWLAEGSHWASFAANFSGASGDYFLFVDCDIYNDVTETDETNNDEWFSGGIFRDVDGNVHVQGTASDDAVEISNNGSSYTVDFNGDSKTFTLSGGDGFEIRTHEGDDDVICSNRGDYVFGGPGDDDIAGSSGNDTLVGGTGDDWIAGGPGTDTLYGGDQTSGNSANAGIGRLYGGDGNDTIYGNGGATHIHGDNWENGWEFLGITYPGSAWGNDIIYTGDVPGGGNVGGDNGNDIIHGGSGPDLLFANECPIVSGSEDYQDNQIYGHGGGDWIYGASGQDVIVGGDGNDLLHGKLLSGDDDIDIFLGGAGNDTIYGYEGADWIQGGTEDDMIYGGDGADWLYGQDGDDKIYGNDLYNNEDSDIDLLDGGEGAETNGDKGWGQTSGTYEDTFVDIEFINP